MARHPFRTVVLSAAFGLALATQLSGCTAPEQQPQPIVAAPPPVVELQDDGKARVVLAFGGNVGDKVESLRRALRAFNDADMTKAEELRWGWFAQAAASAL